MQTITLLNEKGGVGKTTLSVNIASDLAARGYRVVLIDTDKQAHATISLGLPKMSGLYDLLVKENEWRDVLLAPAPQHWLGREETDGALWVLPSNVETVAIPQIVSEIDVLRDRISELEEVVDFVVIDTPPTGSMLQAAIIYASDAILIPTELEYLSMDGLAETAARLKKERKRRADSTYPLEFLGVQPTMFDARRTSHKYGLDQITEFFGAAWVHPALSHLTAWTDASIQRQAIRVYAQEDRDARRAAQQFIPLIDHIERKLAPVKQ
jgi:chromosome partitioning protein